MKRVLITGGTGFIGRHCILPLVQRGYEVHIASVSSDPEFVRDHQGHITLHECNLLEVQKLESLVRSIAPSHLLHLGWNTTHGEFWSSPLNLKWMAASTLLFQAFVECGGERFVGAGTCAEYQWQDPVLSEESSPLVPHTLYGVSKKALFETLLSASKQAGISFAWGRVFFLYGPFEGPKRVVPAAITTLLKNETFNASHGGQLRDFMHVADVGRAFAALVDSKVERAVNIASGRRQSLAEILTLIATLVGKENLLQLGAIPPSAGDPPSILAEVSRLTAELGFAPEFSLREGLSDTIAWWRQRLSLPR